MLFFSNLKTYMCWIWANLSKMALRASFVITYLVLVVILYYYYVYVFIMRMYCYCLILCCFLYLLFCFLILCLISVHVLYVWSGYVIDDLAFSCCLKCCFVSCFWWVKEAIMVILFVFVLYMCFRYMYLRMVSKCCECSWWKNDSINTWSSFCVFPNVSYDMLFLVSITPAPPPPYSSYFYVGMSKKKCVHL
jgi:hypothetical protein